MASYLKCAVVLAVVYFCFDVAQCKYLLYVMYCDEIDVIELYRSNMQ